MKHAQDYNACKLYNWLRIFFENDNWFIVDSDGKSKSSNGTWILVSEESIITNNSVYRAGNFIFETRINNPTVFIENFHSNELNNNEKTLNKSIINANEEENDNEEIANKWYNRK